MIVNAQTATVELMDHVVEIANVKIVTADKNVAAAVVLIVNVLTVTVEMVTAAEIANVKVATVVKNPAVNAVLMTANARIVTVELMEAVVEIVNVKNVTVEIILVVIAA